MVKKLRTYQEFTYNLATPKLERKKLHGRWHLVVPAVMLREGVWTGNNGPILYEDEENKKSEGRWNHKPVTVFHPSLNGKPRTACDPKILDRQMTGFLLDTRNRNQALGTRVWLEERKLKKVSPQLYEDIQNGKKVEVSTGLKMTLVLESGVYNGKKYIGKATEYEPDHLALLPGKTGACSVKDGAGLYQINQMVHNGLKEKGELDDEKLELVNRIAQNLRKLTTNTKGTKMTKTAKKAPKRALVKKLIHASNGSLTMDDDLDHLLTKDEKYLKQQLAWYQNASTKKKKRMIEDDEDEEEDDDLTDNQDEDEDDDEEEEDEDDDEESDAGKARKNAKLPLKKKKVVKTTKKKSAKNEAEEEDDEDDDEEVAVKKKDTKNEKDKEKEFLAAMPKAWRKKFLRMQQNEEAEKDKLIDKIISNPRNEFSDKYLAKKELEELRAIVKLMAKNESDDDDEDDDEDEMFRASAGGADEDDVYNEDGEDPDILPLPSLISYNERREELQKNDSRIGNKRKKMKTA